MVVVFLAFYDMESPPESGSQEMCGSDAVCQDGGGMLYIRKDVHI